MRRKIELLLALGIALAAPLPVYAALGAPVHHHLAIHHRTVVMRAEAGVKAAILDPAQTATFGGHETDGLSRNPEDCVTYGCIDSGGD
jgi:hypothetical protein